MFTSIDKMTDDIEQEEQKVDEREEKAENIEQRLANLEQAMTNLAGDESVIESLATNRNEARQEVETAREDIEKSKQAVSDLHEQIQLAAEQITEEFNALNELESMGEDVSEAREILEDRSRVIQECHNRVSALAQRLGISSGEISMENGDNTGRSGIQAEVIGDKSLSHDVLAARKEYNEAQAIEQLGQYMRDHNYGKSDFETYTKDPEWVMLHRAAYPESDLHNNPNASVIQHQAAMAALTAYIHAHNYTAADQPVYMKDPEWQQLYRDAYPSSMLPIKGFLSDINPNYNPYTKNPYNDPYHNNCGSCALAVEERLSGKSPAAVAGEYNIKTISGMEAATGKTCTPVTADEVVSILRSKGAGSHLIAGIDRASGAGHWFNVFFDGERVYAVDGQDGKIRDWPCLHAFGNVTRLDVMM